MVKQHAKLNANHVRFALTKGFSLMPLQENSGCKETSLSGNYISCVPKSSGFIMDKIQLFSFLDGGVQEGSKCCDHSLSRTFVSSKQSLKALDCRFFDSAWTFSDARCLKKLSWHLECRQGGF